MYAFDEFYLAKNALRRYDARQDYLNYGYWAAGEETANPSATLVLEMAKAAGIGPGSVVVTLGLGLGQPDLDLARECGASRVVGINSHAGQVAYANQRAREAGCDDTVEHRVGDVRQVAEVVGDRRPTQMLAIESLAEMPDSVRCSRRRSSCSRRADSSPCATWSPRITTPASPAAAFAADWPA